MNRNLILGFLGGVVFVLSVIAGALAADAFRDNGGGEPQIPTASGDRVPLLPAEDVTGFDGEPVSAAEAGYTPTEVAGEFSLLDEAPSAAESVAGGSAADPSGGDTGGGGSPDGEDGFAATPGAGEPAPGEDRGTPWEVEDLGFSIVDLLFGDSGFPLLRFLDFCADNPDHPGCPPGTGGTVLAPFGDHLAVGEFRLGDTEYEPRSAWWTCAPPARLRSNEYFILVRASHPARIEIDYYPSDDRAATQSTVVDLTDPAGPVFTDFVAQVAETGHGPGTGVHHCFVLEAERRALAYTIEARATSFTGETAAETYTFWTREQRSRPPVQLAPLSDYEATLVVPVKSEPRQNSIIRLIPSGEGLECSDIEDSALGVPGSTRRPVVPREPGAPWSGWHSGEPIGDDIINAPAWRYDPAYDTYQYWALSLKEGEGYQACVWWVQSPTRSFDPVTAGIVERETRYISTPERLRTRIMVRGVEAPSSREVRAGAFTIFGRSHCPETELPLRSIEPGTRVGYNAPICNYFGYRQPEVTELTARFADGTTQDFVVATPNIGEPRTERVRLHLSQTRASGLCGGSFGDCDPPTSTVPVAVVSLDVVFEEGGRLRSPGWRFGEPFRFDAPVREPEELPERIRIDTFSSTIEANGRNAIAITANFDRPVTLRASVDGDIAEQCFTGEAPTVTKPDPLASQSLVMGGLCANTWYAFQLDATDEAGTTTTFAFHAEPGEINWPGIARTDGYEVSYQITYGDNFGFEARGRPFNVTVGDRETSLVSPSQCLDGEVPPFQVQTWGDTIEVEIFISVAQARRRDGFCTVRSGQPRWQGSVATSFTIEEFRMGPIEILVPLEPIDGGATSVFLVRVRVQGSVTG